MKYFDVHKTNQYNRGKLANNTKPGMIACGIIDREIDAAVYIRCGLTEEENMILERKVQSLEW